MYVCIDEWGGQIWQPRSAYFVSMVLPYPQKEGTHRLCGHAATSSADVGSKDVQTIPITGGVCADMFSKREAFFFLLCGLRACLGGKEDKHHAKRKKKQMDLF